MSNENSREKRDHWYEMTNFNEGPSINISVRRTHLYEDAFDRLRPENRKYEVPRFLMVYVAKWNNFFES